MSKHTLGPWTQEGSLIVHYGDDGRTICQMSAPPKNKWVAHEPLSFVDFRQDSEICSNARLIAAAPDMLEALRFAKEVIDDQAQRFHQACRCQLCESLPQTINAAIDKAEGR